MKLMFVLLSLTIGGAAVVKTADWMNQAAATLNQAMDSRSMNG